MQPVAAIDSVKHPDVNGIEPVSDSASAGGRYRWCGGFADRGHHRVEDNAGQLRGAAFEQILLPLRPSFERKRDVVGLEQGLVTRIIIVTDRRYVDQHLTIFAIPVRAHERESRIAAHHGALMDIEDAASRAVHGVHLDLVKSLSHCRSGLSGLRPVFSAGLHSGRSALLRVTPAPRPSGPGGKNSLSGVV